MAEPVCLREPAVWRAPQDAPDFEDPGALVRGSARGIGRAMAAEFATRGAYVAITYLTRSDQKAATVTGLSGGPHLVIVCDVTDAGSVERTIRQVASTLDRLDVVANNSGVWLPHPVDAIDYDGWRDARERTLAANLLGPANVMYCAARWMREHGGGRIINVSSRGAFRGEPMAPAYATNKAGLNVMSQSLAVKLGPRDVYVAVVATGFLDVDRVAARFDGEAGEAVRPQSPMGRVALPEEVARAVANLASPGAEFATGSILDLNRASYLRS